LALRRERSPGVYGSNEGGRSDPVHVKRTRSIVSLDSEDNMERERPVGPRATFTTAWVE